MWNRNAPIQRNSINRVDQIFVSMQDLNIMTKDLVLITSSTGKLAI